jgi:succinate dehydrogenase/fumarate reductase flavoprotein subunit
LLDRKDGIRPQKVTSQVQELMQQNVWLRRDEKGLTRTLTELKKMQEESLPKLGVPAGKEMQRYLRLREALEAINIVECGQIVATAALTRKESRGSHQRSDYPNMDNRDWLKNIILRKERGKMKVITEPVVVTSVPLPEP